MSFRTVKDCHFRPDDLTGAVIYSRCSRKGHHKALFTDLFAVVSLCIINSIMCNGAANLSLESCNLLQDFFQLNDGERIFNFLAILAQ